MLMPPSSKSSPRTSRHRARTSRLLLRARRPVAGAGLPIGPIAGGSSSRLSVACAALARAHVCESPVAPRVFIKAVVPIDTELTDGEIRARVSPFFVLMDGRAVSRRTHATTIARSYWRHDLRQLLQPNAAFTAARSHAGCEWR